MTKHHIYWWNLENLFDIELSRTRSEFLKANLRSELKGWTRDVLNQKLTNLNSIIAKFNAGHGPDIMGVCEVESKAVVQELAERMGDSTNRTYEVLHIDSEDKRGIDTALIYDKNRYTTDGMVFTLRVTKRNSTRDLLQFHLTSAAGNELIIILNHWPSRSGGIYDSEPYRIMVAENLAYWIDRIYEERGEDANIILMGDFNDNPFDRSLSHYLMGSNNRKGVTSARSHKFYNLMYSFLDKQVGTHVWGSELNLLDQFLVSKTIISSSKEHPFKVDSCAILDFDELVKGRYRTPVRFSRPSDKLNMKGYSDHLPIELILKEETGEEEN
jgi:endonuclease/exonuclease/phosphatase family metal-dependent hydrolase